MRDWKGFFSKFKANQPAGLESLSSGNMIRKPAPLPQGMEPMPNQPPIQQLGPKQIQPMGAPTGARDAMFLAGRDGAPKPLPFGLDSKLGSIPPAQMNPLESIFGRLQANSQKTPFFKR